MKASQPPAKTPPSVSADKTSLKELIVDCLKEAKGKAVTVRRAHRGNLETRLHDNQQFTLSGSRITGARAK